MRGGLGSFAGGLAQGLNAATNVIDSINTQKAREEEQAWMREQRDRQRTDWQEADAYKRDLKAAGGPVEVASGEVYQPAVDDDGNAMPANPTAGLWMAGGQQFKSRGAADAYAAQAPGLRQAAVMERYGKVGDAMQLRGQLQSQELTGLKIGEAKDQDATRRFARGAAEAALQGWDGITRFATENYNNGLTYKWEPFGSGGARITGYGADGKAVGKPLELNGPEDFISLAIARGDPRLYVERQDKKAETKRLQDNWQADYGLRTRQVDAGIKHQQGTLALGWANHGISASRERREREREERDPYSKLPEAKKLEYQTRAARIRNISEAITKSKAEGNWNPKDANAKQLLLDLDVLEAQNRMLVGGGSKQSYDPLDILGGDKGAAAPPGSNAPGLKDVGAGRGSATQPASQQSLGAASPPGGATSPKRTYSYGLFSGPRVSYLQEAAARGRITADEQDELNQLLATKDGAWFRGRASESLE